jgi:hypothetical protein
MAPLEGHLQAIITMLRTPVQLNPGRLVHRMWCLHGVYAPAILESVV